MAGLIWLFQNIQNAPAVFTDRGTKPMLSIDTLSPIFLFDSIGVVNPSIEFIDSLIPEISTELSDNVFQDTTTTYSDSSVEYSSSTQVYGGVDRQSNIPPIFDTMDNIKPVFNTVGNL